MAMTNLKASQKTKKTPVGEIPVDWEVRRLGEISTFASGGTPNRGTAKYWNGSIPWLSAKDLKTFELRSSIELVTELGAQNGTKTVPAGAILVLVRGMTLLKDIPIGLTAREVTFNQDIRAILPSNDVEARFLAYALVGQKYKLRGLVDQAGHGTGRLSTGLLQSHKIPFPPLPEQKKIAEILGAWDRAIETQQALIDAKTERKRGLMQRLLTGQQRLPGFSGEWREVDSWKYGSVPSDWKVMRIGDVAEEVKATHPTGDDIPVLSCTKHRGLVKSLEYFGKKVFSDDLSRYRLVARGQFAYATNHIEEGSIGYLEFLDEGLISPIYTVFETSDLVDDQFLFRLLKSELYLHIFKVSTSASVDRRGSLRWNDFKTLPILVPPLDEQRRIAELSECADREIGIRKTALETTRDQKRGLMQKLLTGQVRVQSDQKS